jgi:hypothetical protein
LNLPPAPHVTARPPALAPIGRYESSGCPNTRFCSRGGRGASAPGHVAPVERILKSLHARRILLGGLALVPEGHLRERAPEREAVAALAATERPEVPRLHVPQLAARAWRAAPGACLQPPCVWRRAQAREAEKEERREQSRGQRDAGRCRVGEGSGRGLGAFGWGDGGSDLRREAEIDEQRAAPADHGVLGLDVAMHEPHAVQRRRRTH